MNVACDYEAPMQMWTTEKYIASRPCIEFRSYVTTIYTVTKMLIRFAAEVPYLYHW